MPVAVRIMRALVGIRFLEERAENTYGHSTLSRELIDPTFRTMVVAMYVPDFIIIESSSQHLF